MAQTGVEAPFAGNVGKIYTDRYRGRGYDCDVDHCPDPCTHCNTRCRGKLSWEKEDFLQERVVYCDAPEKHPYKVMQSG